MKNNTKWAFLVAASVFMVQAVSAKERELLLFMDLPVVTPSKAPRPISEASATIDVITAKEINELGLRTLADALRTIPGIDILDGVWTTYFTPRGLNTKRSDSSVLVLMDGHPYNEVTRGNADPLQISLTNVKRIEIIKGPGSALYGANAFTGVINIITKTWDDIDGVQFSAGAGNYATGKQELQAGFKQGDVESVFTFWRYATGGISGNSLNTNDDREDVKAFGKIKVNNFSVEADYYRADIGVPGTDGAPTPDFRGKIDQHFVAVDYSHDFTPQTSMKLLAHDLLTETKVDLAPIGHLEAIGGQLGAELQLNHQLTDTNNVIGGFELRHDTNDSSIMGGRRTIDTKAAYLQDEWRPVEKFILTFGGRYDMPSAYENVFSPRANITYKFTDDTIGKASYGEAFRAPNFFELYATGLNWVTYQEMWGMRIPVYFSLIGDENLKPERIKTWEVGISHKIQDDVKVNLNAFRILTDNIISYAKYDSGRFLPYYDMKHFNLTNAEIWGGEAQVKLRVASFAETQFSYAYEKTKDTATGNELQFAPHDKFTMLWYIRFTDSLRLNTWSYYIGPCTDTLSTNVSYVEPHYVHNGKLIYDLSKNFSAAVSVYNIFNSRYEEMNATWIQGTKYLADVTFKF